jgi:hypothetical protein
MSDTLFDLTNYTRQSSSFTDYDLDLQGEEPLPFKPKDSGLAISFGKTLPQLYGGKSVTRRTWTKEYARKFIYAYWNTRRLKALDKDYRYGGKQIGWLRLTNEPYQESLLEMPAADVVAEGFPELSKEEFIERFFDNNPDLVVWVIRFEFTPFDGYKGNEELLGNDQLPTTSGNDQLPITSGNDQLPITSGNDLLPTTSGNDLLPTTSGNDLLPITSGNDLLPITSGNDPLPTTDNLKPEVINLPTTDDLKLTPPTSNSSLRTPHPQAWLTLSEIHRDGGTQPRAKLDLHHVTTLVEVLEDGGELDPVTVFYDGESYWLADGFHRCKAHEDYRQEEINCILIQGTRRDAVLFSVGANAEHKAVKPRSREDKRRAVTMLLNDPEWSMWSDREIARQCKVSQPFVSTLKKNVTDNVISEKQNQEVTYTTKHGTKSQMRTGNIGRGEKKPESESVDNHFLLPTPKNPLPTPPPPSPSTVRLTLTEANDYLIGFVSHIEEMSVGQLEEAQRRIDQRLNRQNEVDALKAEVEARAIERDQFKTEVEAIAIERDELNAKVNELLQEIQALKSRTTRRRKN